MKKISVLMSLYSKEDPGFLKLCLESLVYQTRQADEVIIVIDGPVGIDLESVVLSFSKLLPLKLIRLEKNNGLGFALNEGLNQCSGELIARMDTDDICSPTRLEKQEQYFVEHDVDIIGTAATVIDFKGNILGTRVNPTQHQGIIDKLWCNPFIHPSVMFLRSSVISIGGYKSSLRRRQDYELWFRAAQSGLRFANLKDRLLCYRFDRHTLQKQSPKLAWNQGTIGFKGSMSCKLGLMKSLVCFVPFVRSLLPIILQVRLTQLMKSFDSRTK
tara:strand:- start:1382 stop:2197 length:816 start_codon:yes stop_codon:yes gene_type:complete